MVSMLTQAMVLLRIVPRAHVQEVHSQPISFHQLVYLPVMDSQHVTTVVRGTVGEDVKCALTATSASQW